MKRICLPVLALVLLAACTNSSDSKSEITDSSNSVVLPANRSTDSIPPNGTGNPADATSPTGDTTHSDSSVKRSR